MFKVQSGFSFPGSITITKQTRVQHDNASFNCKIARVRRESDIGLREEGLTTPWLRRRATEFETTERAQCDWSLPSSVCAVRLMRRRRRRKSLSPAVGGCAAAALARCCGVAVVPVCFDGRNDNGAHWPSPPPPPPLQGKHNKNHLVTFLVGRRAPH